MRIVTIRTEKNLNQVLEKFYDVEAADKTRLREATLTANPHLRSAAAFTPGTVVMLPDPPDVVVKNPATNDLFAPAGVVALAVELEDYLPDLLQQIKQSRDDNAETTRQLKSAAFKRAVEGAKSDDADALVKTLTSGLKDDADAAAEALAVFAKAKPAWKDSLDQLSKKLGGSGL